jgi:CRP-like cAMP-binding protein
MDLLQLFRHAEDTQTFTAGQTIFDAGDTQRVPASGPGAVMYDVLQGEVEISLNNKTIETLAPGEIFGELSLVDQSPRSATATAKTDCLLAPVNERRFLFMVQETPYFAIHVMSVLAARLRRRTEEALR